MQTMNGKILKYEPGVPGYGKFDCRQTMAALDQWLESRGLSNRGGMKGINFQKFKNKQKKGGVYGR